MISEFLRTIFKDNFWMVQIFIIVFSTLIIHSVRTFLFKRLIVRAKHTKTIWDDTILSAMHTPFGVLIWLLGISWAASIAGQQANGVDVFDFIPVVRRASIIVILTWFIIRFAKRLEHNYIKAAEANGKKIDKTVIHAISQLTIISAIITASLIGMQIFGFPISGLLAFGGIGGAGIAFASKDMLANFFGGMMIYLDRPFKVGDWIRSPDKNIEGTVEHIGWRLTRIRTFDKRPLYVPNGIFLTIAVENPSRMSNRRIKTNIGVRYNDASKIADIIADVEKMLRQHPDIDTMQTLIVNLVEFGPSSLNFMVYTFTKTTNWVKFQAVQQDVFLKIIEIIEAHNAECAFPTQTIHIPEIIKHEHASTH